MILYIQHLLPKFMQIYCPRCGKDIIDVEKKFIDLGKIRIITSGIFDSSAPKTPRLAEYIIIRCPICNNIINIEATLRIPLLEGSISIRNGDQSPELTIRLLPSNSKTTQSEIINYLEQRSD